MKRRLLLLGTMLLAAAPLFEATSTFNGRVIDAGGAARRQSGSGGIERSGHPINEVAVVRLPIGLETSLQSRLSGVFPSAASCRSPRCVLRCSE
jgi:hypothetical protein